jgi:hypothetical protein
MIRFTDSKTNQVRIPLTLQTQQQNRCSGDGRGQKSNHVGQQNIVARKSALQRIIIYENIRETEGLPSGNPAPGNGTLG